jgi:hypothetical protein
LEYAFAVSGSSAIWLEWSRFEINFFNLNYLTEHWTQNGELYLYKKQIKLTYISIHCHGEIASIYMEHATQTNEL